MRIFPAVKLRPQTPPIDKREIGDAAKKLGSLANERAVSTRCDVVILVGKIRITSFLFYCEGMLSLVVL